MSTIMHTIKIEKHIMEEDEEGEREREKRRVAGHVP